MAIRLTAAEERETVVGEPTSAIAALEQKIADLQLAQIVHGQRAILIVEGWEAAGRRAALRRIAAAMDPCHLAVHCTGWEDFDPHGRHWLARFWAQLPTASRTTIFDGSWYRLLAARRAAGEFDERALSRACDEINEFEAQQRDHGTLIVKLFFHITVETHLERLRAAEADPWRGELIDPSEVARLEQRADDVATWEAMFAQTDTRWAPWQVINAHHHDVARLDALGAVADALQKAVPADPPERIDTVVQFPRQAMV